MFAFLSCCVFVSSCACDTDGTYLSSSRFPSAHCLRVCTTWTGKSHLAATGLETYACTSDCLSVLKFPFILALRCVFPREFTSPRAYSARVSLLHLVASVQHYLLAFRFHFSHLPTSSPFLHPCCMLYLFVAHSSFVYVHFCCLLLLDLL